MQNIPKVIIRIILLPCAFILHLIPHIIGLTVNLYRWVKYGGEFITYKGDDRAAMSKIFDELKNKDEFKHRLSDEQISELQKALNPKFK